MSTKKKVQKSFQVNVANVLNAFGFDWDYTDDKRYVFVDLSNSITINGKNAIDGWHEVPVDMLEGAIEYAVESTTVSRVLRQASRTGSVDGFDDHKLNDAGVYLCSCIDVMAAVLKNTMVRHEDGSYGPRPQDMN